ncbi:helix-turn-helix domain-containing protein [Nocardioides sp. Arc9.136]|uniref:helix-turn-helix domain-containing protein n=1 Tax=Nocardioides sp. Arc9.136 TaxID=2996826 RepID=UPI002666A95E|nr:helix-turn-helix domain-containing protein [Nocardioides sp. Arc9.136]WKN47168.1 helix-turn-helix domain-containing protein [Nocardioides sp. Arc9.136]
MDFYTATIDVNRREELAGDRVDELLEQLATYHAAIGTSPRGFLSATITVPAESLAQATTTALAVVSSAFGAEPIACTVLTTAEHDARQGWESTPEVVSVSEAATLLGISRQAVLQRIAGKSLPATRVGRSWTVPRAAVDAIITAGAAAARGHE